MIGHHDHAVNDDTECHGDSCQRVKVKFYFEKLVEHEGDRQIGKQAGGDNAKVTEIPAHEVYEKE